MMLMFGVTVVFTAGAAGAAVADVLGRSSRSRSRSRSPRSRSRVDLLADDVDEWWWCRDDDDDDLDDL